MPPKYDFRLNPVYYVDVQNLAKGKLFSATKRRVQFKFGFSNREAIAQGLHGVDARGEEHEVTLVWSLVSGKRHVHADGREVHYSRGNRSDPSFETSWTMFGGHTIKVVAHAFPPLNHVPGFHQFDLLLDGCSIYDMPKIYELGTDRSTRLVKCTLQRDLAFAVPPCHSDDSEPNTERESSKASADRDHSSSADKSMDKSEPARQSAPIEVDLLDSQVDLLDQGPQFDGAVSYDAFSAPGSEVAKPSFDYVASQVMSSYAPTPPASFPPVLVLANESHTYGAPAPQPPEPYQQHGPYATSQSHTPTYQQPQQPSYYASEPPVYYAQPTTKNSSWTPTSQPAPMAVSPEESPVVAPQTPFANATLTMNPITLAELEMSDDSATKTELERALDNLVNLDDISQAKQTPEQIKAEHRKQEAAQTRSKPAPARTGYLGSNATLADIQTRVGPKPPPTKEIMRTHSFHPNAAQAEMLVVYGQSAPYIPPTPGFGVAAMASYHRGPAYYGQHQPAIYATY